MIISVIEQANKKANKAAIKAAKQQYDLEVSKYKDSELSVGFTASVDETKRINNAANTVYKQVLQEELQSVTQWMRELQESEAFKQFKKILKDSDFVPIIIESASYTERLAYRQFASEIIEEICNITEKVIKAVEKQEESEE